MSHIPVDPTKPKDPVLVARRRPDTVSLAGVLMVVCGGLGVLNAGLVIAAAGAAARAFRERAGDTGATAAQIDQIATSLATWTMTAGLSELVLSVVTMVLARRVLRGGRGARTAALGIAATSILCGLGWSSFTVRAGGSLRPDGMDPDTGRGVAEAIGVSTSGPSTYIGGGLTCLQVLGYIAVLGLLLWPASHPYFRRGPAVRPNAGNWLARLRDRNRSDEPDATDPDVTEPAR